MSVGGSPMFPKFFGGTSLKVTRFFSTKFPCLLLLNFFLAGMPNRSGGALSETYR